MRLKDKLIRKNCPACGDEITLGTSSLNKKIKCPKCRQTVIIYGEGDEPPEKFPAKRMVAKEKRSSRPAPTKEPTRPAMQEEPPIFIQSRFTVEEAPVIAPQTADGGEEGKKRDVVYCLCNGMLKRRINSNGFSSAPGVCCVYADQPGS